MAQGDVVNDAGIDIAGSSNVTVQPPSGEHWDIRAASKSTGERAGKNDGVIVGLYNGSEREAVAGPTGQDDAAVIGGDKGGGTGGGIVNSIQINNSVYLNFREDNNSSGQINYSGVQIK